MDPRIRILGKNLLLSKPKSKLLKKREIIKNSIFNWLIKLAYKKTREKNNLKILLLLKISVYYRIEMFMT